MWCVTASPARKDNNLKHWGGDKIYRSNVFSWLQKCEFRLSQKFVSNSQINNMPELDQIIARRRSGKWSLSEPMMPQFADAYKRNSASMCYDIAWK